MTTNLPSTSNVFTNRSGRLIKGLRIGWNQEWIDQDGCEPPGEMLVAGIKTVLQRWQGGLPTVIDETPLPDPDFLNSAIPIAEWELDMNKQPSPPWKRTFVMYLIDPIGAGTYTFITATTGGRMCFEALEEAIETKKMLVGGDVLPLVSLDTRPMKTRWGDKSRPALTILSWRTPGNGAGQLPASPPLRLLDEGATCEAPAAEPEAAPEPAKHTPIADTVPPAGRKPGKTEFTGRQGKTKDGSQSTGPVSPQGKSKIRLATETRRPDLRQDLNEDIPF
jgi:hypothetical protein